MNSRGTAGGWPPQARVAAAAAAVGLLAALPYLLGGVNGAFVAMDDNLYVTENPPVRAGLTRAGARWALTSFYAGNWHPLTWLSHMADVTLFGLDARGHHLTSILLHALAAVMLTVALYRMTGALGRSAFVAALFGVHPLHVESVAWVAERKDVLSGLLFALVLLAYERYARRPGPGRYLAVAALLALGLAAKPMLVTVPGVLWLLDFWPLGRVPKAAAGESAATPAISRLRLAGEKLPLLALCAGAAALTLLAQVAGGTVTPLRTFTPGLRLANALVAYAAYLGNTLWPAGLAVYYPHPLSRIPPVQVAAALLALAALGWAAWSGQSRRPFLATGWLWYLGMLVPVIGIVQVGAQARADRYTYLPLIGIFLMLAWWLPATPLLRRLSPRLRMAGAVALLISLAGLSQLQVRTWRDSETLFRRALAVTTDNWLIHNNLGGVLVAQSRLEEATEQFVASLKISPWPDIRNNLGTTLLRRGKYEQAAEQYRLALQARPGYAAARHNLGLTLATLGRTDEAIENYREALRLQPGLFEAALNLGRALHSQGRRAEAAEAYRAALHLRPGSAEARTGLAAVTRQ